MHISARRAAERRTATPNVADQVTERLREAITDGSYEPKERLIEEDVAHRFKTNRATVRMAMARLEHEGLIVRERNRGARVRLVSEREALEILEARAALEAVVARYAAARATRDDVARLRAIQKGLDACHRAGDLMGYADLNVELHRTVTQLANHGTATRLLGLLKSQSVRYQYRSLFQPGRIKHSMDEHRKLIAAIIAKDPQAAEDAMREHLQNAVVAFRRWIENGRNRSV